jgi:hypothetical protein
MTDAADIMTVVKADPTLASLIGGRIYPMVVPQKPVLPAVTLQLVSQPIEGTQDRALVRYPRWRFRIVSEDYSKLEPIAAALSAIFNDTTRTPFDNSVLDNTTESREPQTGRFWRLMDVIGFDTEDV